MKKSLKKFKKNSDERDLRGNLSTEIGQPINSTLDKVNDFLESHSITSSTSLLDPIANLDSDNKTNNSKQKSSISQKIITEQKRIELEEIENHLKKRNEELKKRSNLKLNKIKNNDLSYCSSEFLPNIRSNISPFKQPEQKISNRDRIRLISNKKFDEFPNYEKNDAKNETRTHAFFAHLVKLKKKIKKKLNLDNQSSKSS